MGTAIDIVHFYSVVHCSVQVSLWPLFAGGKAELFVDVAVAQIFTLLLMYSACDAEKSPEGRSGNVGTR